MDFFFIIFNLISFFFRDTFAANSACRKLAVSLADSVSLRTLLSLLYTMTQVLRSHKDQQLKETFINDLSEYEPQWSKNPFLSSYLNLLTPHIFSKKILKFLF